MFKGFQKDTSGSNDFNALQFMIKNALTKLKTFKIVKVLSFDGEKVDCDIMVDLLNGFGDGVDAGKLYNVPVLRLQAGNHGFICDPVAGDIGVVAFCDRDSTTVLKTRKKSLPNSFSIMNGASPIYLGLSLLTQPDIYIKLKDSEIEVKGLLKSDSNIETSKEVVCASVLPADGFTGSVNFMKTPTVPGVMTFKNGILTGVV